MVCCGVETSTRATDLSRGRRRPSVLASHIDELGRGVEVVVVCVGGTSRVFWKGGDGCDALVELVALGHLRHVRESGDHGGRLKQEYDVRMHECGGRVPFK